ncbi:hypothetical protein CONLIGDRAFT_39607 [Coniochaeta ligniaria NRRL 30616]|uniref:Small secreted protein n=1 Tax=Coniochaeta ligniaria NRRL 30616 TaxID=1408157 RepID=A0A1J7J6Q7_9PEZI|nr:hypothetical protein CONLIGDRAFT_39607 [Coniochaeta ligniaria NRRL 30616]
MFFKATILFSLAVSALALPATLDTRKTKTTTAAAAAAATGTAGTAASVLTVQDYADFQVSDGVAGNALAEVNAKFPIDATNLAAVSADDLAIINAARVTAEAAETDTGGFNDAIDAAGGTSSAAGEPLQVGKIKNKVLKLQLEVLALQIQQAQNGKDNSAKIAAEQTKLNNNIKLDAAAAGQASQSVDFQGDDSP